MAIAMDASSLITEQFTLRNPRHEQVVGGIFLDLADALRSYDIALAEAAAGHLRLVVQARAGSATCPACGVASAHVCSRYWRSAADITAFGLQLQLQIRARRFRCCNPACPQRVFAERLPDLPAWARRSERVSNLLAYTALSVGGLPGQRVAALYGLHYSRQTLLRAARRLAPTAPQTVRVLGVDDYAYRRGRTYGTLLYDWETRQVVDLLPERSAALLAAWLQAHPGVEVISRDRAGVYAEGSREGAPSAIQVADRFHLMQNLGDCLERVAQKGIRLQPLPDQALTPQPPSRLPNRTEQAKLATRARRQQRQDAIRELFQQGASIGGIAAALHLGRTTVRRYLHTLPDNARASILDPYADYLQERWQAEEHNGRILLAELRTRGYTGSQTQLYAYLQPWRDDPGRAAAALRTAAQTVSPRAFRRLVLKKARTPQEELLLARVAASDPALANSIALAHEFARTFREHDAVAFDAWLDTATASALPEWRNFADGLRRDLDAVHNGITLCWNQGPVEGSITRLKLIKRAMYGRGNHDLLCRRVLCRLH